MKGFRLALGVLFVSAFLNSCVKQSFDNPPDTSQIDPKLPVNATLGQLSSMAIEMGANTYRKMGDTTVSGVVTADDRSGNFYKQIIIQDATGAIVVTIDQSNLYTDYPIGRKVYVKLKDLILVNYHGLPEIAFDASTASGSLRLVNIPSAMMQKTVVKASYPNTVTPEKVKFVDLFSNTNKYLNKLVQLDNMEFDASAANVPYAAPSSTSYATSRTIKDCPNTGSIVMYNSGFANFQPYITPSGKGSITGIFSMYNTSQFLIRDTTDVQLTGARDCP